MCDPKKITLSITAVLVLAVLAFGAYRFLPKKPGLKNPVFCTQEAFMCPDGSFVSRTGADCKFAACPDQESFTGILRQDPDGFSLVIASPTSTGEVDYRMPLLVKTTNVIGQFVGQKVKAYGTFTEGAVFALDRLEELPGDAGDPTLGEIGVGQTKFVNGVNITLNKIIQDSRCPVNVQCIQAGSVTVNATLKSDTDKETRDIASNASVSFDSFQISIVNIKPARAAQATPPPEVYLITFKVQARKILPADSESPAAGICELFQSGDTASVRINQDVPSPRCLNFRSGQVLSIRNTAPQSAALWFGDKKEISFSVAPNQDYLLDKATMQLLAPGVHILNGTPYGGPEVWVRTSK